MCMSGGCIGRAGYANFQCYIHNYNIRRSFAVTPNVSANNRDWFFAGVDVCISVSFQCRIDSKNSVLSRTYKMGLNQSDKNPFHNNKKSMLRIDLAESAVRFRPHQMYLNHSQIVMLHTMISGP